MPRQAGDTTEIEITPEMIEAGVDAFDDCNDDEHTRSSIVEIVYIAMVRAKEARAAAAP